MSKPKDISKNISILVQKYLTGESNREELEEVIKLISDPSNSLRLRPGLFNWWNSDIKFAAREPRMEDTEVILDKIHHRINLQTAKQPINKKRKQFLNALKIAAILIIGLLSGMLVEYIKTPQPVYYTSVTPKGSISQMVLPDNTMVYLNSGSELKYASGGKQNLRNIYLNGEAWFDVAENGKKPFIVHTPTYNVQVIGTQFNVKAYSSDNEIVTTLEEGLVQITSSENVKLNKTETLHPGEQLVYNRRGGFTAVKEVKTRMFTAWKDNELIFINMKLKELFMLLERKYGVNIEVADNMVLNYHYDGTIRNETIMEVLTLLKETLPVDYRIEGQKIIIEKK